MHISGESASGRLGKVFRRFRGFRGRLEVLALHFVMMDIKCFKWI